MIIVCLTSCWFSPYKHKCIKTMPTFRIDASKFIKSHDKQTAINSQFALLNITVALFTCTRQCRKSYWSIYISGPGCQSASGDSSNLEPPEPPKMTQPTDGTTTPPALIRSPSTSAICRVARNSDRLKHKVAVEGS